jgi:hypothetical protein
MHVLMLLEGCGSRIGRIILADLFVQGPASTMQAAGTVPA